METAGKQDNQLFTKQRVLAQSRTSLTSRLITPLCQYRNNKLVAIFFVWFVIAMNMFMRRM